MQNKHEEYGPSEQERGRNQMRPLEPQTSLTAVLKDLDPVQTGTMEQRDQNQNQRADAQSREWLELVRNLSQECWNRAPQSTVVV